MKLSALWLLFTAAHLTFGNRLPAYQHQQHQPFQRTSPKLSSEAPHRAKTFFPAASQQDNPFVPAPLRDVQFVPSPQRDHQFVAAQTHQVIQTHQALQAQPDSTLRHRQVAPQQPRPNVVPPHPESEEIKVVSHRFTPSPHGPFHFEFESENGIKQSTVGELKSVDESEVIVMRGSYQYIGDDGQTYIVEWEADENGFRPSAPHLPQPVPIPFPEQKAAVEAQLQFTAREKSNQAHIQEESIEGFASRPAPSRNRRVLPPV